MQASRPIQDPNDIRRLWLNGKNFFFSLAPVNEDDALSLCLLFRLRGKEYNAILMIQSGHVEAV